MSVAVRWLYLVCCQCIRDSDRPDDRDVKNIWTVRKIVDVNYYCLTVYWTMERVQTLVRCEPTSLLCQPPIALLVCVSSTCSFHMHRSEVHVQPRLLVVVQQIGDHWLLDYYGVCFQPGECRAYDNDRQESHGHEFPHHSENTSITYVMIY